MAGYTVTALAVEQKESATQFTVALSVLDANGSGVPGLRESDITVQNLTGETHFALTEMRNTHLSGFYRLSLRAEPAARTGVDIFALVITHRHIAGRLPGDSYTGSTLVEVRVA